MSRRNVFQDPSPDAVEPALGMDTTSPLQAVPQGFVRSLKNGRPGLISGYKKRDGYSSVLTSAWDTRSLTAGIEYQKSDGNMLTYLFGTDGSGTGGKIGYIDSGAVTSVVTGLSGTARPSFVQVGDLLMFFNGSDAPVVIADTTSRQMGITGPVAAPSSSQTTTGNLVQTATYLYAYTYYNSVTGAESTPSPILSVTLTATNDQVDLTLVAGSSSTADTIRVYRSYANGQQLFLEGTNAINDTTYSSTVADSSLETQMMELDNTRITTWSSAPQYPCVAGQRLWLKTDTNEIRCSKWGQEGAMFESFPVTHVVDCTGTFGAADEIIGIAKAGDRVIVLKERSVGTIEQSGFQDATRSEEVVLFTYREISTAIFPAGHSAATELNGECVFLGKDNIYAIDSEGRSVRPVADQIAATILGLGFSADQCKRLSAINDAAQKELRFQVFADSSATTPDYCIVGTYSNPKAGLRWSWDTPGTDTSSHPGIRASCYFHVTESASGAILVYAGGVSNGKLYEMNDGTDDDGSDIYFEVIDRPRTGGSADSEKLWKDGGFYCSGSGADYDIEVSSIYDLSGAEEDVKQISLASGGDLWDNSNWDTAEFGGEESKRRKYQTHRKAFHRQLVFRQTESAAPITLFSWINSGSLFRLY